MNRQDVFVKYLILNTTATKWLLDGRHIAEADLGT